ncbi:replication-associated recombination protein A [bacterium]|nr:MAG: replication-associated recombination protein A [bacterium]
MDLFNESDSSSKKDKPGVSAWAPLATRMRPRNIDEYVGQSHILGEGKLLRKMIDTGVLGSVIFYGPPSAGKTTLANVISAEIDADFIILNAVLDGTKDLKEAVAKADYNQKHKNRRTLLFVDEIHRWNKAQQDALLPHVESGLITLIGATTENPFYSLVGPLLSRCQLFELHSFSIDDLQFMIDRAVQDSERGLGSLHVQIDDKAKFFLAEFAGGDIRQVLNALEIAARTAPVLENGSRRIDFNLAQESIQKRTTKYDRTGDQHYHYASAFIKSLRGSDVDAALYWVSAMLSGGEDPNFVFRRLLIFCSEDIGMADPNVIATVNALQDSFHKVGMPEGWYFISHAVIYCALAPKSNSTKAIFEIASHIEKNGVKQVPEHLKDKTANALKARYTGDVNYSDEYLYPHEFPNHWVNQQYLPDELKNKTWFEGGTEGFETRYVERLRKIRS